MSLSNLSLSRFRPSASIVLLTGFLLVLWLAGGASREDATGQTVVRTAAWIALVAAALSVQLRGCSGIVVPGLFLCAAAAIAFLQLLPLPPDVWQALPGREPIVGTEAGTPVWRPWSIVPGATVNAFTSLVVPAVVLLLMAGARTEERCWLPSLLVVLFGLSLFVGLLQFSGAGFNNPLINDTPGAVGGPFANRNHFALFLAIACVVSPVWAFSNPASMRWSVPVALGICVLSMMTILATGSRAGLLLAGLALVLALLLVRRNLRHALRRRSRWAFPMTILGLVVIAATLLSFSVAADRAVSIDRLLTIDTGQDMRSRGLPTVFKAIGDYFPTGSGLGGFDPIFRLHEPVEVLKPTYFNHVHNDFFEIMLDTGIAGAALLAAAIAWWAWASVRAWRHGGLLSKSGSSILLLVLVASLTDYPIRTPLIMAVTTIAAIWLAGRRASGEALALPNAAQRL